MIQRQGGDRADSGNAGAINRVDVEANGPPTAEKRKYPAPDDRTSRAEQNINNGSLARGADRLAGG